MDPLTELARRATGDPFFLGCDLAGYAASERLDDAALAAKLGVAAEGLTMLRLCRSPREDVAGFREDMERVATKYAADVDALMRAVRHARVLAKLRAAGGGGLMAARDAEPEP
ncbi:MAG: hypothetical protein U0746_08325 [Gemmataceae bacterium]